MESPDKRVDSRPSVYSSTPTIGEGLQQARQIEFVHNLEDRASRLHELNERLETSIGYFGYVYADSVYDISPLGLERREESSSETPHTGVIQGFCDVDDIDNIEGSAASDNVVCLRLYLGQMQFTSKYTKGVFSKMLLIPVTKIREIESQQELNLLYRNPERHTERSDDESRNMTFERLSKHIEKLRKKLDGKLLNDPRISEELEPCDYKEGQNSLYDFRNCKVTGSAEYGIVRKDDEFSAPVETAVKNFEFTGYYLGATGYVGKKRHYKPHLAFEIFNAHDDPTLGSQSERVSPVLLVPISNHVTLGLNRAE